MYAHWHWKGNHQFDWEQETFASEFVKRETTDFHNSFRFCLRVRDVFFMNFLKIYIHLYIYMYLVWKILCKACVGENCPAMGLSGCRSSSWWELPLYHNRSSTRTVVCNHYCLTPRYNIWEIMIMGETWKSLNMVVR